MEDNMPEFSRAEYTEAPVLDAYAVQRASGAFAKALGLGALAAGLGSAGYALIGFSGFMVSIVAIGVGWLVAKAMMTGSGGFGGKPYQVAAVLLTYFACTLGDLLDQMHYAKIPLRLIWRIRPVFLVETLVAGPFMALNQPINGVLGLVILFVGLRTAWLMARGGPGFAAGAGGARVGPFGLR